MTEAGGHNRQERGSTGPGSTSTSDRALMHRLYEALKAGRAREVEAEVNDRLRTNGNDTDLLRVLAVALFLQNRYAEAVDPLSLATQLDPRHAETWSRLGLALDARGEPENAASAHDRAVELAPDRTPFRLNAIANANKLGDQDRAQKLILSGLEYDPDQSDLLAAHGTTLKNARRPEEACEKLTRAFQQQPRNVRFADELAKTLDELGQPDAAIRVLLQLLERQAMDPQRLERLIVLLLRERRIDDAEAVLNGLNMPQLIQDSSYSRALGRVQEARQHIDEARRYYEEAMRRAPERVAPLRSWLLITPTSPDDPKVLHLQRLYDEADATTSPERRSKIGCILAKIHWEHGDHTTAMAYMHEANRLLAAAWKPNAAEMDRGLFTQLVTRVAEHFRTVSPYPATRPESDDDRPVFILGMPRSGKTLIESMLGEHPGVARTDEDLSLLTAFRGLIGDWTAFGPDPLRLQETLDAADTDTLRKLRTDYLQRLSRFGADAHRYTQTTPFYLPLVGLIHQLFPNARFIFCRRDPEDLGLACYGKDFGNQTLMFATDLYRLGQEIRAGEMLMDHWRETLPAQVILQVDYEQVVADPTDATARMCRHIGLDPTDIGPREAATSTVSTSSFALTGSEPGAPRADFVGVARPVRDHLERLRTGYADGPYG